mmetsp:Transcript_36775/g.59439  ORF Transcript_36775/g.59439 Transcript_36775/m.59439 type:complete len:1220 (+) Transcript_36775:201-3860(+)|eukprot:CAMPEP_0184662576 /NCGR_PEP_ID=MMETSP0308-20130426/43874_1 /TAXON_ID=38269 /ORGANISM="Gloeochaete witrockiana, Strain SAG 46.84" /LENGTH=1219 /DNA_ID=CAMNT_0027104701 /DNA_START=114 /DNA_END=3773 /DNA_ORIENTATION=-
MSKKKDDFDLNEMFGISSDAEDGTGSGSDRDSASPSSSVSGKVRKSSGRPSLEKVPEGNRQATTSNKNARRNSGTLGVSGKSVDDIFGVEADDDQSERSNASEYSAPSRKNGPSTAPPAISQSTASLKPPTPPPPVSTVAVTKSKSPVPTSTAKVAPPTRKSAGSDSDLGSSDDENDDDSDDDRDSDDSDSDASEPRQKRFTAPSPLSSPSQQTPRSLPPPTIRSLAPVAGQEAKPSQSSSKPPPSPPVFLVHSDVKALPQLSNSKAPSAATTSHRVSPSSTISDGKPPFVQSTSSQKPPLVLDSPKQASTRPRSPSSAEDESEGEASSGSVTPTSGDTSSVDLPLPDLMPSTQRSIPQSSANVSMKQDIVSNSVPSSPIPLQPAIPVSSLAEPGRMMLSSSVASPILSSQHTNRSVSSPTPSQQQVSLVNSKNSDVSYQPFPAGTSSPALSTASAHPSMNIASSPTPSQHQASLGYVLSTQQYESDAERISHPKQPSGRSTPASVEVSSAASIPPFAHASPPPLSANYHPGPMISPMIPHSTITHNTGPMSLNLPPSPRHMSPGRPERSPSQTAATFSTPPPPLVEKPIPLSNGSIADTSALYASSEKMSPGEGAAGENGVQVVDVMLDSPSARTVADMPFPPRIKSYDLLNTSKYPRPTAPAIDELGKGANNTKLLSLTNEFRERILHDISHKLQALAQERATKDAEIVALRRRLTAVENTLQRTRDQQQAQFEERVRQLLQRVSEVESQLETKQIVVGQLQAQKESIVLELRQKSDSLAQVTSQVAEIKRVKEAEVADALKLRDDAVRAKEDAFRARDDALHSASRESTEKLLRLEYQLKERDSECVGLEKKVQKLEDRLREAEETIRVKSEQLVAASSREVAKTKSLDDASNQMTTMSKQVVEAKKSITLKDRQLHEVAQDTQRLKARLQLEQRRVTARIRALQEARHIALLAGGYLYKFSRDRQKNRRWCRLVEVKHSDRPEAPVEFVLEWSKAPGNKASSSVNLHDVTTLLYGPPAASQNQSKHPPNKACPWRTFTIITPSRAYQFEAADDNTATLWFMGLQYRIKQPLTALLSLGQLLWARVRMKMDHRALLQSKTRQDVFNELIAGMISPPAAASASASPVITRASTVPASRFSAAGAGTLASPQTSRSVSVSQPIANKQPAVTFRGLDSDDDRRDQQQRRPSQTPAATQQPQRAYGYGNSGPSGVSMRQR